MHSLDYWIITKNSKIHELTTRYRDTQDMVQNNRASVSVASWTLGSSPLSSGRSIPVIRSGNSLNLILSGFY